jgi:predicted O-methyltransferase YrrM
MPQASISSVRYPKLNPGAIIVADNMIGPGGQNALRYIRAVRAKPDSEWVTY